MVRQIFKASSEFEISSLDLCVAVQEARRDLVEPIDSSHYLNAANRFTVVRRLAELADGLKIGFDRNLYLDILKAENRGEGLTDHDGLWACFLGSFQFDAKTILLAGAYNLFAPMPITADVGLRTLLWQTVTELEQRRFKYADLADSLRVTLGRLENGEMDEAKLLFCSDLPNALEQLSCEKKSAVAKWASEALIFWESGRYRERKIHPLGFFPQRISLSPIDGENEPEVMAFLNELGFKVQEEDRGAVMDIWLQAWRSKLDPDKISFDLDHTTYDYSLSGFLFNCEKVTLRESAIFMAALALKNKKSIRIVTHTLAMRVAALANQDALGLLKFAMFLRLPEDPRVTEDEVMDFDRVVTFEKMAQSETHVLQEWARTGHSINLIEGNTKEAKIILTAMSSFLASFKEFIRGQKTRWNIALSGDGSSPEIHVDDSASQAQMLLVSGCSVVKVPKSLTRLSPDWVGRRVRYGASLGKELINLSQNPCAKLGRLPTKVFTSVHSLPVATIRYPYFIKRAFQGWVTPSLKLMEAKFQAGATLLHRGEIRPFVQQLRANFFKVPFR